MCGVVLAEMDACSICGMGERAICLMLAVKPYHDE